MQMISEIKREVDLAQLDQGEVLFMDQRQLITFNYIQNLAMVDDYEKKVLIDTAFSEDKEYFQGFYDDLVNRRSNLILREKLNIEPELDEHFPYEHTIKYDRKDCFYYLWKI